MCLPIGSAQHQLSLIFGSAYSHYLTYLLYFTDYGGEFKIYIFPRQRSCPTYGEERVSELCFIQQKPTENQSAYP